MWSEGTLKPLVYGHQLKPEWYIYYLNRDTHYVEIVQIQEIKGGRLYTLNEEKEERIIPFELHMQYHRAYTSIIKSVDVCCGGVKIN